MTSKCPWVLSDSMGLMFSIFRVDFMWYLATFRTKTPVSAKVLTPLGRWWCRWFIVWMWPILDVWILGEPQVVLIILICLSHLPCNSRFLGICRILYLFQLPCNSRFWWCWNNVLYDAWSTLKADSDTVWWWFEFQTLQLEQCQLTNTATSQ